MSGWEAAVRRGMYFIRDMETRCKEVLMKEYEPYRQGMNTHQCYLVSKEEQARRKKAFLELFKNPLLEMGFIQ